LVCHKKEYIFKLDLSFVYTQYTFKDFWKYNVRLFIWNTLIENEENLFFGTFPVIELFSIYL
jgi:hypothetical protein